MISRGCARQHARIVKLCARSIHTDHDYTLQVGRAIRTLRLTLPHFFDGGLAENTVPSSSSIHPLYAPDVQLQLRQFALPSLHGRGLYLRSSGALRLAFIALHSHPAVTLKSVRYEQRNRDLRIALLVGGVNRLTNELSEWDVLFRYAFNDAGLIDIHEVMRISPPPTSSAVEGLRAALMKLIQHRNAVACEDVNRR